MNRFFNTILVSSLFILLGAASCNKKAIPVKSDERVTDFSDDLSRYRPKVEAPMELNITESQSVLANGALVSANDISDKINVVLDTISVRNKRRGYVEGYTILVYSGTSRAEAERVRNRLYDIVGIDNVRDLQYVLPTYFVKTGKFFEQIEGQTSYLKIRSYYPNATIVPEKFVVQNGR